MLEVIGFLVVVWIGWSMVKVLFRNSVKATVARSIDEATRRGVPREFAREVADNPELVTTLRTQRARMDKDFAAQDAHVQYGQTIKDVHSALKVEAIIKAQVEALKAQGILPTVTVFTFAYVTSLVLVALGPGASLETIKGFIERAYAGESSGLIIDASYHVAQSERNFPEMAVKLFNAAQRDFLGEESNYLIRLGNRIKETGLTQGFDYVNV
jgi:hypothetical protein